MSETESAFQHPILQDQIRRLNEDGFTVHHYTHRSADGAIERYSMLAVPVDQYLAKLGELARTGQYDDEHAVWPEDVVFSDSRLRSADTAWETMVQASETAHLQEEQEIASIALYN